MWGSRFRLRTSRPKRAEGIDRAYVSRVFKLTRVSPVIVEQALAGKVTMEALMAMGGCWVRQGVGQNITYSGMDAVKAQ